MGLVLRLFVLVFLAIFPSSIVHAKDLSNRLGIGIKNNNSVDLPAIAAVYYPNADVGFTGSLGVDTQDNESKFAANAGIRKILFREDHMNFYYGGQVGLVNFESSGNKESGFELNVVFGGEFFFAGLDSLGFSFEGGVGLSSLDKTRFRTVGDDPLKAGLIFYF
jgi:hypothetical protein